MQQREAVLEKVLLAEGVEPDAGEAAQASLPLAAEGVQRIVCKLRHADILLEVVGEQVFVNGQRVEPAAR